MADGDRPLGVGLLTYNGFTFSATVQVKVTSNPQMDDAQRTVKYVTHVITAEDRIHDDTDTGSQLEIARRQLTTVGSTLAFSGFGFGVLNVTNAEGETPDSFFGPIPKILDWQPVGGSNEAAGDAATSGMRSVKFRWQVEVHVPECSTATYQGVPMAYGYGIDWSVSRHGMTVRTISGYIEIPMTRNAARQLPDSADRFFERVDIPFLQNFQRQWDRRLSLNHARVDFTVTDTEIPSAFPYPLDVIDIDLSHEIHSDQKNGWNIWSGSISGRLYPSTTVSKAMAWRRFVEVINTRLADVAIGKVTRDATEKSSSAMIVDLKIREDVFARPSSFSLSYVHFCSLETILSASGLWAFVTTSGWPAWAAGMAAGPQYRRGQANMVHAAGQDAIVDLCGGSIPTISNQSTPQNEAGGFTLNVIKNEKPKAETSWGEYQMRLAITSTEQKTRHKPIPPPSASPTPSTASGMESTSTDGFKFPASNTPDIIQQFGEPSYSVVLSGYAARAGYQIPIPRLATVGGQAVQSLGTVAEQAVLMDLAGVPLYGAWWSTEYMLLGAPTSPVEMPPAHMTGNSWEAVT